MITKEEFLEQSKLNLWDKFSKYQNEFKVIEMSIHCLLSEEEWRTGARITGLRTGQYNTFTEYVKNELHCTPQLLMAMFTNGYYKKTANMIALQVMKEGSDLTKKEAVDLETYIKSLESRVEIQKQNNYTLKRNIEAYKKVNAKLKKELKKKSLELATVNSRTSMDSVNHKQNQ